jgi:hypothetical protein|tara:strand:+ start:273 stop:488 length:216 start_codon:yes stop_codon:yes gene_type:complete
MVEGNLKKILGVQCLKQEPKSNEAEETLRKLVKWTAPMVSRRGWTVKVLKEFYPSNKGLLGMNVNRGARYV